MRLSAVVRRGDVRLACLALLCCMLLADGCVTQEIPARGQPPDAVPLIVTRAGEQVTLTWRSRKGARYTIFYSDSTAPGARWNALPGHVNLQGTGQQMWGHDLVPDAVDRRYKLDTIPPGK